MGQSGAPRYGLARRILFPYSGKEVLTRQQGLRVIFTWCLIFPGSMAIVTLLWAILSYASWEKTLFVLLAAFLSGVLVFGTLAWLSVNMSNQSVRYRQQREAARTNNSSGGRYGS